ncbi:MAG: LL-diaminopimelate aminotransferase [Clostridiales bacterium]|nr:LL-diaminopimelate aminotransferase [Clostridiales bacterium]
MKLNPYIAALPAGYLFAEIAKRVKTYSAAHPDADILKLGIGDVTRPLSRYVADEMAKAAAAMGTPEGFRGYGPDYGYEFLINAIIENDYKPYGVNLDVEEVFISDGAKPDVGNLQELFSPDAVIAVTDPVYPVYVDSNAMAGRLGHYEDGKWSKLCYLPCNAENGFVPEVPKGHVDVIYLCYPNNPTGTVLTREQLKPFVDYARAHDAIIVYDSAYKAFISTPQVPHSIYEVEGADECAIECCSFSKTAGFTGVRCGYMVIPKKLTGDAEGKQVSLNKLWQRRTSTKFNGVSYPVQVAAAAVYAPQGKKEIQESIDAYLENARIIREGLEKAGCTVFGGVDSPYVWMKTPGDMKSWDFFDLLLTRAHVVGTPGEGFGPSGEGYFRLTAFNTKENTIEAVKRIVDVL